MKTYLKTILLTWVLVIACCSYTKAYTITGPTCVSTNVPYVYTFSSDFPSWPSQYTQINGGYLINLDEHSITIIWSPAAGVSPNMVSYPNGMYPGVTLNVSVFAPASSNTINLAGYITTGNKITDLSLTGGDPGGCGMVYSWEDAKDGNVFSAVANGSSKDYTLSNGTSNVITMRRQMWTATDPSTKWITPIISVKTYPVSWGQTLGRIDPSPAALCTSGTAAYTWTESTDGVNWTNISTSANAFLYVPALTATHYYKMIATCGGSVYSTTIFKINVAAQPVALKPGTITGPAANPPIGSLIGQLVTDQPTSDGNCTSYSYQWEQSTDGTNFTPVVNATDENYTPDFLYETTWYRRKVSCSAEVGYSNVLLYHVIQPLSGGLINPGGITVPATGNYTFSSAKSAVGGDWNQPYNYQWEISLDDPNHFNAIVGATSADYSAAGLTKTSYIRRKITCGTETAYSNTARVVKKEDDNFIREVAALKAGMPNNIEEFNYDVQSVQQSTMYLDGLARPVQAVMMRQSLDVNSNLLDVVTLKQYDNIGREPDKFLAYASSNNEGNKKNQAATEQKNFYNTYLAGEPDEVNIGSGATNWAFSREHYEPSPLSRTTETFAPGVNWVGTSDDASENNRNAVKVKYLVNTTLDAVRKWTVDNVTGDFGNYQTAAGLDGVYPAGELYKNITIDESNKQIIEFKDKYGLLILKKAQATQVQDNGDGSDHDNWLCTYYIYDELHVLRAVVQPRGVELLKANSWDMNAANGKILSDQCFRYEYDNRMRMIIKQTPGGNVTQMVYDTKNRLVMVQDANQRDASQMKWTVTQYDDLNRPIFTWSITDPTKYLDAEYHRAQADLYDVYPVVANYANDLLIESHYDNYDGLSSPFSTTSLCNSGYANYLNAPASENPDPLTPAVSVNGFATWSRMKVIGNNTYITACKMYDVKGRLIQTQTLNYNQVMDVVTNQYSFTGRLLRSHIKHQMGATNTQVYEVATKDNYDILGRLSSVEKSLNGSAWKTLASLTYDALGRLKTKTFAPAYNNNLGLETLNFDYNVRGWVLGVNRAFAKSPSATGNWFGYDLGYDKKSLGALGSYQDAQLNGNINGTVWRSIGDGEIRKYDYSYDPANRLIAADFKQNDNGFTVGKVDFSVSNLTYDANGNIMTMDQKGLKVNSSSYIDQLHYTYIPNSNKLLNVTDASNDVTSKLGDFRYTASHPDKALKDQYAQNPNGGIDPTTITDYVYDKNGNLVSDKNKDISSITYNYLNLPQIITVNGKGTINYVYDAVGNKLQKITFETGSTDVTTTDTYVSGIVYETKTYADPALASKNYTNRLLYIPHEEGRIRYVVETDPTKNHFEYDYFIKDQLDNVRMVLSEEKGQKQYVATMELGNNNQVRNDENQVFNNIDLTSFQAKQIPGGSYPNPNTLTNPNEYVSLLNAAGHKIGPGMVLKVMSGDVVDLGATYYFRSNDNQGGGGNGVVDILTALADGLIKSVGTGKGSVADLSNPLSSPLADPVSFFRTDHNPDNGSKPKAYLNWIFLDDNLGYLRNDPTSGALPVDVADAVRPLAYNGINITKNGYLYVYVSNESNWDVYFDDLVVTHKPGALLEETHYYPFGLTMAGISSKALGPIENKNKFNGLEQNNDLDLNQYDAFYRNYNPQIGRWFQPDPKPADNESPYAGMGNNPILRNDLLGDTSIFFNEKGDFLRSIDDGSKKLLATIIPNDYQKGFNLMVNSKDLKQLYKDASGNFDAAGYAAGLRAVGVTYDLEAFSKFYQKYKSAYTAKNAGGESLEDAISVLKNGKSINRNILKSEVVANLVLENGVITIGRNTPTTTYNMLSTNPDAPGDEPGKIGSIHLHPTAITMRIDLIKKDGGLAWFDVIGGNPSGSDYGEYGRSGKGYRFVMVDQKSIYIYNQVDKDIKLPRR